MAGPRKITPRWRARFEGADFVDLPPPQGAPECAGVFRRQGTTALEHIPLTFAARRSSSFHRNRRIHAGWRTYAPFSEPSCRFCFAAWPRTAGQGSRAVASRGAPCPQQGMKKAKRVPARCLYGEEGVSSYTFSVHPGPFYDESCDLRCPTIGWRTGYVF